MAGCAACIARRCCLAHGGYYEWRQPWLPLSGLQPTVDNIPIANCKKEEKDERQNYNYALVANN